MNLGIDKISCITQEFRVENLATFNHTPSNQPKILEGKEVPPKVLTYVNGNPILSHTKALKIMGADTDQHIGIGITPSKHEQGANGHLSITFNPSKYADGGYELCTSKTQLAEVFKDITNRLKTEGIHVNLEATNLQRIDLTKQAEMPRIARDYMEAYDHLHVKYGRQITRHRVNADYYRLQNKSWQLCAYDKQMAFLSTSEKTAHKVREITPSNLLRNELRFMNSKTCKEHAYRYTGETLQGQESWEGIYTPFLQKRMFNQLREGVQLRLPFATEIQTLIEMEQQPQPICNTWGEVIKVVPPKKRGLMDRVTLRFGINEIIEHMSLEAYLSLFADTYNKSQLAAKKLEYERALNTMPNGSHRNTLINELETAFLIAI